MKMLSDLVVNKTYYLGTDKYGRDIISRLVVGSRVSIAIGFVSVIISLIVGLFLEGLQVIMEGR